VPAVDAISFLFSQQKPRLRGVFLGIIKPSVIVIFLAIGKDGSIPAFEMICLKGIA
jgi:hypothetical protein